MLKTLAHCLGDDLVFSRARFADQIIGRELGHLVLDGVPLLAEVPSDGRGRLGPLEVAHGLQNRLLLG